MKKIETYLSDVYHENEKRLVALVEVEIPNEQHKTHGFIQVTFEGYGLYPEDPDAPIVLFENRNGVPHVVIWGDIECEEPTHTISLEKAKRKCNKQSVFRQDDQVLVITPPKEGKKAMAPARGWVSDFDDVGQVEVIFTDSQTNEQFTGWFRQDTGLSVDNGIDFIVPAFD